MRAVVYDRYGPPEVLRIEDVPRPHPGPADVLVRVHATTVNRSDCHVRMADPFFSRFFTGVRRPRVRILGSEFAGTVESVGAQVDEFALGDAVFGDRPWQLGAHAEYLSVPASGPITHKPAGATFEEAAAVCDGAILALMCLRPARLRPGKRILVYGASGSIGTAAVQLAKVFGAHVTAVCTAKNLELMTSLGADEAIDYERDDFTANGQTYDAVFDAVGRLPFSRARGSLAHGGVYLATDHLHNLLLAAATRLGSKRVVFPIPPRFTKHDVVFLKTLIEGGRYHAVIDRVYPIDQVIEASRYVETKQKTGNVVLSVWDGR